jgi:phosphate transport system protein
MTTSIGHHISRQFDTALEDIRSRVLAMGGLVEQQLRDALRALMEGSNELAEFVLTNDHRVNAMEVAIDEECVQVIARRQPAASDLRLLIAVIKTITDLERIGDEAERIARMTVHLIDTGCTGERCFGMDALFTRVQTMLHSALDAFARLDVDAAVAVAREDSKVNQEYVGLLRQQVTYMMEDPRTIARGIDIMWIARALERIGDHTRNIGEYIVYLVRGKDVRHTSLEQMERAAHGENGGGS